MKFKNFLSKEIFVCIITQPAFISSLVFFFDVKNLTSFMNIKFTSI